jgi:hypothetical protein
MKHRPSIWLYRGPERGDRIPLGGGPCVRSVSATTEKFLIAAGNPIETSLQIQDHGWRRSAGNIASPGKQKAGRRKRACGVAWKAGVTPVLSCAMLGTAALTPAGLKTGTDPKRLAKRTQLMHCSNPFSNGAREDDAGALPAVASTDRVVVPPHVRLDALR